MGIRNGPGLQVGSQKMWRQQDPRSTSDSWLLLLQSRGSTLASVSAVSSARVLAAHACTHTDTHHPHIPHTGTHTHIHVHTTQDTHTHTTHRHMHTYTHHTQTYIHTTCTQTYTPHPTYTPDQRRCWQGRLPTICHFSVRFERMCSG